MIDQLHNRLTRVRRRLRANAWLRALAVGALLGSLTMLATAVFHRVGLISPTVAFLAVVPLLIAVGVACRGRVSWQSAGAAVDSRYDLKDRTVSMLQLASMPSSPVTELQARDALNQLDQVRAEDVVAIRVPASFSFSGLTLLLAIILLCQPATPGRANEGGGEASPVVLRVADDVQQRMDELQEQLAKMRKEVDPQDQELIDKLVDELAKQQRDLKQMKPSESKRQAAMAELSKLEMVLDKAQQQAAQDFDSLDKQFKSIGKTLSDIPQLKPIEAAQKSGDYKRLAEELEKADKIQFDKRTADPLGKRLEEQANRLKDAGQKELSDAARKMSKSLRDPKQRRLGSSKLAAAARRQALRQQMMRMLNANKMALKESKQELRGKGGSNSRNVAETKKGSQRWGKGEAGNKQGPETKMASKRDLKKVQGKMGQGDSQRESVKGEQVTEKAQRKYRDTFARFEKISEAVLESEPLPLGHRQTIRRYFRSIRPEQSSSPAEK